MNKPSLFTEFQTPHRIVLKFAIIFFIASASSRCVPAQKFSTYYHQRKSFFEILPDSSNEIIFLGNSITDGCNWAELFDNILVKNRGISGDITAGILFRLGEVLASKPEKIFIMIGINDLARGNSIDSIIINYTQIIARVIKESPKTKLYVQSVLPVNPKVGDMFSAQKSKLQEIKLLNQQLEILADKFSFTYLNIHDRMTDAKGYLNADYTNDGLHLTGAGYFKWKDVISDYME